VFSSDISGGGAWGQRIKKDRPEENKATNMYFTSFKKKPPGWLTKC
jgi:hypothetical protein